MTSELGDMTWKPNNQLKRAEKFEKWVSGSKNDSNSLKVTINNWKITFELSKWPKQPKNGPPKSERYLKSSKNDPKSP